MARRAHRRNPATTAGFVVNSPRRRRKSRRSNKRRSRSHSRRSNKRRSHKRRANSKHKRRRSRRSNTIAVQTNGRRKKRRSNRRRSRRANSRRRSHSRRRNYVSNRRRRSNKRRRNTLAIRTNGRKRRRSNRRRGPKVVYRYRANSRRHRRSRRSNGRHGRRRNPAIVQSIQGMVKGIPFLGNLLSSAVGFAFPGALGALSVIPTTFAAKQLAQFIPGLDSRLFYALTGIALAVLVKQSFIPLDSTIKNQLAAAFASAGGAVAYYKHMSGGDHDMAGELGLLEYGDYTALYGDAMGEYQYSVIPGYAGNGYGALMAAR